MDYGWLGIGASLPRPCRAFIKSLALLYLNTKAKI